MMQAGGAVHDTAASKSWRIQAKFPPLSLWEGVSKSFIIRRAVIAPDLPNRV